MTAQATGTQCLQGIQGKASFDQLDRRFRAFGKCQAQSSQHQFRGKRVPLAAQVFGFDAEWQPGIELLENLVLVGADRGHRETAQTDINSQDHDAGHQRHPEYRAQLLKVAVFQSSSHAGRADVSRPS